MQSATKSATSPRLPGRLLRAGATFSILATALLWTACGDDDDDDDLDLPTATTAPGMATATTDNGGMTPGTNDPDAALSALRTDLQAEPWFASVESMDIDDRALVVVVDTGALADGDAVTACSVVATRAFTMMDVTEVRFENPDGDTIARGTGGQCQAA